MGYLPEGAPELRRDDRARRSSSSSPTSAGSRARSVARGSTTSSRGSASRTSCQQVIETLSKGFRRRVGLAQAILHDPRVLILDEPTDGLDPNQKHEVRTLINDLAKDKIIVISTHILEEVDAVCSRAIIIADGRLLADDTPRGLEARSRWDGAVTLASRARHRPRSRARRACCSARKSPQPKWRAPVPSPRSRRRAGALLPVVTELVKREGWNVEEVRVERGRLDEVFRAITRGGDGRGALHA